MLKQSSCPRKHGEVSGLAICILCPPRPAGRKCAAKRWHPWCDWRHHGKVYQEDLCLLGVSACMDVTLSEIQYRHEERHTANTLCLTFDSLTAPCLNDANDAGYGNWLAKMSGGDLSHTHWIGHYTGQAERCRKQDPQCRAPWNPQFKILLRSKPQSSSLLSWCFHFRLCKWQTLQPPARDARGKKKDDIDFRDYRTISETLACCICSSSRAVTCHFSDICARTNHIISLAKCLEMLPVQFRRLFAMTEGQAKDFVDRLYRLFQYCTRSCKHSFDSPVPQALRNRKPVSDLDHHKCVQSVSHWDSCSICFTQNRSQQYCLVQAACSLSSRR